MTKRTDKIQDNDPVLKHPSIPLKTDKEEDKVMATILIVDDASFMRNSLKYIVESAGHTVIGMAKEGQQAVDLYKKNKPDVVTLDFLMTGMDGFSALKAIKKENPKANVIMVTAVGNAEKQEEARRNGVAGYIRKPFKPTDIVSEIDRVINKDKI
jgi:two-component system chemotaxis response regulator CheY